MKRSLIPALVLAPTLAFLQACGDSPSQATSETPNQGQELPRIEHFKGKAAPDWSTALENLRTYIPQLEEVLAAESLEPSHMDTIHQLTYTLENAVERIQEDLVSFADALEEVHQASETDDEDRLRTNASIFLQMWQQMFP